ncbi:MAG: 23S rRNA (uracil(1939)-C(5))-methyltransferase RlmD [Actinobacteria bacterium]|nr:23S rRNA (uracil(1939)-C(5))-methyltransferase RlmD [Actinomycetota bacterium]
MEKPFKSQELDLAIDSLAFGGRGVARHDGFVVFVEGAVPGDRVRAVVTRARRSYAEARVVEILNSSTDRKTSECVHFGICGGCSWQTLSYEAQLRYKQQQVVECLGHIGGITEIELDEPIPAEPLWRYRNKVEFSFAAHPTAEPAAQADLEKPDAHAGTGSARIDLGFHLPGEWWRVVDIEDCLLHSEETNAIRLSVRDYARESGMAAWDQKKESGFWRHLVLREGINTGEIMVNIVTGPGEFPDAEGFAARLTGAHPGITSLIWSINDTRASVATGFPFTVLAGRDHIFEEICGLKLKVSPRSFMQTNTLMAERLYERAREYAGLTGEEFVFDLYSGIGSIALYLAKSCSGVLGVEIVEDAVELARQNARDNDVTNCRFITGKVRTVLKELELDQRPHLVILDPPRAGASKKEVNRIIELDAPRIVYISCNASTLAGNASQLREGGYRLVRASAVDMFPHTPHIEVVALFEQEQASPDSPASP